MNWQKFYSLEPLIKKGRELSRNCDVVTFDLFDTLFIRRIHDPDLVKLPVSRYISARAAQRDIKVPWRKIQKIRDRTEQDQRQETGLRFEDKEACYPDFMTKSLKEIFGTQYHNQLLDDVTRYELEMESRMLVPREKLVDWLAELHQIGKKIYISIRYIPSFTTPQNTRREGRFPSVCRRSSVICRHLSGKGFRQGLCTCAGTFQP